MEPTTRFNRDGDSISPEVIRETTLQQAKEFSEQYEEQEFLKRKRMGLSWYPVRSEFSSLWRSLDNTCDLLRRSISRLAFAVIGCAAADLSLFFYIILR